MSFLEKFNLKRDKKLYIGVAVVAVIAIILLILAFTGGKDTTSKKDNKSTGLVLSNSVKDHTLRLEGKVYKLPISYSALSADGWVINSLNADMNEYLSGRASKKITLIKGEKAIDITLFNDGENACILKDCMVGAITVFKENKVDFCVASEVSLNISTEHVIQKLGEPTNQSEGENYIVLNWSVGDSAGIRLESYYGEDEKYNNITIANFAYSKNEVTPKAEAPKYLDDYIAPEKLGDKLSSPCFSLNGVIYELPVPLREINKSGFIISTDSTFVISGGSQTVKLIKDDAQITVEIANPTLYKTNLENCIVTRVLCVEGDKVDFSLSKEVKIGLEEDKLKAVIPKGTTVQSGAYSTNYSYTDYKNGNFSINISVDNESKKVNRISLENLTPKISSLIIEE